MVHFKSKQLAHFQRLRMVLDLKYNSENLQIIIIEACNIQVESCKTTIFFFGV